MVTQITLRTCEGKQACIENDFKFEICVDHDVIQLTDKQGQTVHKLQIANNVIYAKNNVIYIYMYI